MKLIFHFLPCCWLGIILLGGPLMASAARPYRVYVPVANQERSAAEGRELLEQLGRIRPDGVFICTTRCLANPAALVTETARLQRNMELLRPLGVRIGIWACPVIGYSEATVFDGVAVRDWTHLKSIWNGEELPGCGCPTDERYMRSLCGWFRALARLRPDTILLEDDYNFTGHSMFVVGCACTNHLRLVAERLGRPVDVAALRRGLFTGGSNDVRDAWLDVMGGSLRGLTAAIRSAVDEVDPGIRIGLSANRTSFDFEGVDIFTLARIAAGTNRPLIRLTSAPYWRDSGMTAAAITEAIRLEAAWCPDPDTELIAEGDTFPRPRFYVGASELEVYDTAVRTDARIDGILKYMLDYVARPSYETGYVDAHVRDRELAATVLRWFRDSVPAGLAVVQPMAHYRNQDLGTEPSLWGRGCFLMMSQRFLTDLSVPLAYGTTNGACAAFGDAARALTAADCRRGVVTDVPGAKRLMERGIDTGIASCRPAVRPVSEFYPADDERLPLGAVGNFFRLDLRPGAEVKSLFEGGTAAVFGGFSRDGATNTFPACYSYRNAQGGKFLVYAFDLDSFVGESVWATGVSKNYCRQRQILAGIAELQGRPVPASCPGHPFLQLICGEHDGTLSVGLWNLGVDPVFDAEIRLDRTFGGAEFFGCAGRLEGDRVRLSTVIEPHSACLLRLRPPVRADD